MSISIDTAGLTKLIGDLEASSKSVVVQTRDLMEQSAIDVRDGWRANARESAGTHGKRYPTSIRYRMILGFEVGADIGPQGGKQSDMSFEFGSANQPAHLDGQRALDDVGPRIMRRFDSLRFLE